MTPDPEPRRPRWRDLTLLRNIAYGLAAAAAGWYLLVQLAPVLRPLLIATLLAYILLPYHSRLRKHVGAPASIVILAGATAGALVALALVTYASVLGLSEELPRLQRRAVDLTRGADRFVADNFPWLRVSAQDNRTSEERLVERISDVVGPMVNAAAGALLEACVVAMYLLFLLLEASRFPDRIRKAYPPERAERVLQMAGQVNEAVVSFLKAKVQTSFFLAAPIGLVLWAFGVKFALLWAILSFLCNFIPYVGSVVAYTLPVAFAFLQLDFGWQPFAVAGLLLGIYVCSASVVEPTVIGKAVGLSPLVILGSLAFWGLLWGISGMFVAVPLTVVAVLVMDQFEATRPIARMVGGD